MNKVEARRESRVEAEIDIPGPLPMDRSVSLRSGSRESVWRVE